MNEKRKLFLEEEPQKEETPYVFNADIPSHPDDRLDAIEKAAEHGDLSFLQRCLELGEENIGDLKIAFEKAAEHGHLDCVKLLLPYGEPKRYGCMALKLAIDGERVDCVEFLAPLSNPSKSEANLLDWAVGKRNSDMVKLLIPHTKPRRGKSQALFSAVMGRSLDCVELLLPHSHVNVVAKRLQEGGDFKGERLLREIQHKLKALKEAETLTKKYILTLSQQKRHSL